MGRKLYCGNLSYNVSSADLEELFSEFGTVESAQVISDRDTGRSKGFGFVEMATEAEAQAATAAGGEFWTFLMQLLIQFLPYLLKLLGGI